MNGKLNVFQKTMLQWNRIHPYNAIHIARIMEPLDPPRLAEIIGALFEGSGLTGLDVDSRKGTYHYRGGPARTELKIISGGDDPSAALSSEIEKQLNEPFAEGPEINPFRFFVVEEETSFHLGLVYFHFVSGAEDIISLMKHISDTYADKKAGVATLPLKLYPGGYIGSIRVNPGYLIGWALALPSLISSARRSFRPPHKDPCDHSLRFSCFSIGRERFQAMSQAGKRWGVTLNDLFLALLLKSISPLFPERFRAPRRKNISIASIVNIRKDLNMERQEAFGLFLGSFVVSHIVPEGISLEELTRDVHRQTLRIKRKKLYLLSIVKLGLARIIVSLLSDERRKKFYQKNYPLGGGITNINLDALWKQEGEKSDYLRVVCTGPVSPLVLSITTVKDMINIGMSFKSTVYSEEDIETIIMNFKHSVEEIKERA